MATKKTNTKKAASRKKATKKTPAKASRAKPAKKHNGKLSAISAAAKVLGETKKALNCKELVGAMAVTHLRRRQAVARQRRRYLQRIAHLAQNGSGIAR